MYGRYCLALLAVAAIGLFSACADSSLEPGDGHLPVEGGSIFYRVVGSGTGTPLLLLHGGPGYTGHYLEPLGVLGDDRPVVVYDQLGSGRSDRVTEPELMDINRYVRELDSLRSALGLEEVHLFGHSWGAMLALEYLATDPSGIVSLTLASPVISIASWAADGAELLATLPETTRATIEAHEAAGTTSSQEYQDASFEFMVKYVFGMEPPFPPELDSAVAGYNPAVYETMWGPSEFSPTGNLQTFDRAELLNTLQMPVLFTAGRFDEARPETLEGFAQAVPNAEVRIFESSAHLPMLTERDAYAEAVRDFLRRSEG
jgi:proline iminopeptidase